MLPATLEKHLSRHPLQDGIMRNYIDRGLYLIAVKEIPRVLDSLNTQISELRMLERLLLNEYYGEDKEELLENQEDSDYPDW